jgi:predicted RNA methylase
MWRRLPVLPGGLDGAAAVELGCGCGYVSPWLGRRGTRLVGVDVSARQLAVARRLQGEFGLRFPLVQADAERVPLGAGCADLYVGDRRLSAPPGHTMPDHGNDRGAVLLVFAGKTAAVGPALAAATASRWLSAKPSAKA